jgi:hypothetical protein
MCLCFVLFFILLGVQKFKCGGIWSVHFDARSSMFVLKHFFDLLCLFLCFNVFLQFILFLHLFVFRIIFSALAAFTRKIISWATSIRLRLVSMRWKLRKGSTTFVQKSRAESDCSRARKHVEVAEFYLYFCWVICSGLGRPSWVVKRVFVFP